MNANTAWQAAVGQLQMEMSKASFDTWVRSAEVVKYQDGQFTIGVQNAYARDWLEKRPDQFDQQDPERFNGRTAASGVHCPS